MKKNLKLSEEKVKHVAKLAKLELSNEEVKKFQQQLQETLDYVEILNELETSGVESTSQVTGLENVFREDEPGQSITQEEALSGTKNSMKGMFKIKAIF